MFDLLKKLKEKREAEKQREEQEKIIAEAEHRRHGQHNIYKGMYCPTCGYMTVNENSNELPMEGFALCPNCGDHLKTGWFLKNADGFSLSESPKAAQLAEKKIRKSDVSGGHYRVRTAGPARGRVCGHWTY